jgi:hypothetical protein
VVHAETIKSIEKMPESEHIEIAWHKALLPKEYLTAKRKQYWWLYI